MLIASGAKERDLWVADVESAVAAFGGTKCQPKRYSQAGFGKKLRTFLAGGGERLDPTSQFKIVVKHETFKHKQHIGGCWGGWVW